MREEKVAGSDGGEYDVLFYYTALRTLRDGRVAGVGYGFLSERVPRYRELAGVTRQGKK